MNCVALMFFKLYISVNICFQHSSTHKSYIGNFPVLGLQHKNEKANNTLELKLWFSKYFSKGLWDCFWSFSEWTCLPICQTESSHCSKYSYFLTNCSQFCWWKLTQSDPKPPPLCMCLKRGLFWVSGLLSSYASVFLC